MTWASARSQRACTACFLGLLLSFGAGLPVLGFSLLGYTWPPTTQIRMHLDLSRAFTSLQDGSASWNDSAADALNTWNQYIDVVRFVPDTPSGSSGTNAANDVFFSSTVYGQTWPTGVLAVTLKMSSQGNTFTETDVLFNDNLYWDSYRGPRQGVGPTGVYDLHRVALHEFGHVLGLDHPDQHGQSVIALMNSVISDLDQLADDDIAGARALYAARITSTLNLPTLYAGNAFSYQITANNSPTSFEATGLPPGLSIDSTKGLITGTPTASGAYSISLIAHGATRDARATLSITLIGAQITSSFSPSVYVNDLLNYTISATNHPFAFDVVGLPSGLSLDRSSGVITGTLGTVGSFPITVIAHTPYGDGSAQIVIRVIPWEITSNYYPPATIGGNFRFQITANNNPTSFEAINLPAGLQLDAATGVITGTITLSGNYNFTVIAHGAKGDATKLMFLGVQPAPPLQPKAPGALKTFDFSPQRLVFDPTRSRLYASDQTGQLIVVIDTVSLTPIATIKLPNQPSGLALSADNSKLWVASFDVVESIAGWITAIDLNTLQIGASYRVPGRISSVAEGPANRIYVSGYSGTYVVDGNNGAILQTNPSSAWLAAKAGVLFMGSLSSAGQIWAYDISQNPMHLSQQTDFGTRGGSSGVDLKLSHNGKYLCYVNLQGNGQVYGRIATALMPVDDVRSVLGNFVNSSSNLAISVGPVAFSSDDTVFYQPAAEEQVGNLGTPRLEIFDVASFAQTGQIDLGHLAPQSAPFVSDMVVDNTDAYIFVATSAFNFNGQLRVYPTGRGTPPAIPAPSDRSVLNVSTRLRVDSGDNAGIGGFIIQGAGPKKVMVRAIGPSLAKAGVSGALSDPSVQVFDSSGQPMGQNDNWNSNRAETLVSGLAPTDEHEAALILSLPPGAYTAVVRGVAASGGVAVVEVYDLSGSGTDSKLANISTRGKVGVGDLNAMIGGFIVGGSQPTDVVVRAIGPSLANYGVGGALADPTLEVHDSNGALLAQDDDWRQYQEEQLTQTGLAPTDDHESAMVLLLQPGAYTAIVRGKNNGVGVGLVEVYNLDAN